MNKLTVLGTITRDKLYFKDEIVELHGGAPWFALDISKIAHEEIDIITNVGSDFSLDLIPKNILEQSIVNQIKKPTTSIEIFMTKGDVPAIVKEFTGKIKNFKKNKGDVLIISTLLNEVGIESLKILRRNFKFIILDIQGFTRPDYKKGMKLSDDIKVEPLKLKEIAKLVNVVKCNESELNAIFNGETEDEKIKKIHQIGINNVIITRSSRGSWLSEKGKITKFDAHGFKVKNFLGAGDKFLILVGMGVKRGLSLPKSIANAHKELIKFIN